MLFCSRTEVADLRIASALDLRAEPHACKKAAEHSVVTGVAVAPLQLLPVRYSRCPCRLDQLSLKLTNSSGAYL